MQLVCAGFRDDIKYASSCAPKLHPEVGGLNGNLLDCVGDGEYLFLAADKGLIVLGSVKQVIIPARALTIDREAPAVSTFTTALRVATAPDGASGSFGRARQCPRQRYGI